MSDREERFLRCRGRSTFSVAFRPHHPLGSDHSRSPTEHKIIIKRDRISPHERSVDSLKNNRLKRYSRSRSRSRKMSYREDRERDRERRRDDRDRDREGRRYYRSRSRSRSPRRYKSSRYSRSRSRSYGRRSHSHSPMSSRRRHNGTRDNPNPSRCLGVFGLSEYSTEEELYHIMTKYGPVERVQVVIDAKTGRSRGFSFVYFESVEDAKVAKEQCTGMKINGKSIRVDYSITQRAHTPTPGIYMGKPTYAEKWDRRRDKSRDGNYDGYRSKYHRQSPSPHYRRKRYERSRSRSYSPRLRKRGVG
ncbi:PREDICTED: transformer-2 protein homolog alpha-like isoform X3 [Nicrophorus vespilloides]|uniref:Transformer-2 protein homolog alpha-like isoform X3 n=1 Tax=Nicrophorus vespilloides TaxID=110193 RepID=A0ABM1N3P2_NICVS|nr:PREDICTED: transformer-2 protein homolog alpha-like isoform X3 [Nicrophorus vespilloides]